MKRTLFLMAFLASLFQGFSQTKGISYQAVLLNPESQEIPGADAQGNILANSTVSLQFTIVNASGTEEYQEYHSTNTDRFGMINLLIGTGIPTSSNDFNEISWNGTIKKLKVGIDFSGGSNFSLLSEQDLTYIPQPPNEETLDFIIDNVIAIEDETARAIAAENILTTDLSAEINRATAAEGILQGNIETVQDIMDTNNTAAETAIALKEDSANKSTDVNLSDETNTKFPTELAVKTFVNASAAEGSGALAEEVDRAIAAEEKIAKDLEKETNRATSAENTLTTDLAAETNRAIAAKNKLTADLASETTRATAAENTLTTDLATETNRATSAEKVLQDNVDANKIAAETAIALKEYSANKSTDVNLSDETNTKFPTELAVKTFVNASAAEGSGALAEEVARATAAEDRLATDLETETTRATAAEDKLTTDLSSETARATSAEGVLQGNIETVQENVDANKTAAETAIALKEYSANKSTDVNLSDETNTKFPTELAVKTFVNASATEGSEALAEEVERATAAEEKLATDLAAETNRATSAEGVLQGNIETVQDNVDANKTAAETAISLKEDTANKSTDVNLSDETNTKFPTELAVKTFVNASAAEGSGALADEVARATSAEEKLTTDLETETYRATSSENILTTGLAAETTRANAAEKVLQENVDTNKTAAETAIALKEDSANKSTDVNLADETNTLFPTELAVKTFVNASAAENSGALADEVARATAAEEKLTTDLDSETTRAIAAENTLSTNLTAETTRATAAEKTLTTDLAAETNRATTAEGVLQDNVDANKTAAESAIALKENSANKSTDVNLGDETNTLFPTELAVKTFVKASAAEGSGALADEVARATAAEEKLGTDLETETTRATSAEDKLTADLSSEIIRATAAENTLTTDLATETNRATTAEGVLQGNIETVQDKVDANKTAAETAIALKEDSDNKSTDVNLADETNTLFPTELAVKTFVNASAAENSGALADEVARATAAEEKLTTDLDSETTRAIAAENTLSTNLTAETTRATAAENTLTTGLAAEINRATAAEGVLQGNIETVQDNVDTNKTYAETAIALKEDSANKSTDINLADETNTLFPTEKAVKTYVDGKVTDLTSKVTGILPVANGGTGSATQNFVDLTTNQTITGVKAFSGDVIINSVKMGRGTGNNSENTAVGNSALGTGTGSRNSAFGSGALRSYSGTGFDNNTSVGYNNLPGLTIGSGNTSVGAESMMGLSDGTSNTSIGNQSLISTSGNNNVGVGKSSGSNITTGSNNTIIGTEANVSANDQSNSIAIGFQAVAAGSNNIQLGNTAITHVKTSGKLTTGTITLPNTDGTAGQVLSTDGSGVVIWITPNVATSSDFVDLTSAQNIGGSKTFNESITIGTVNIIAATDAGSTLMGSGVSNASGANTTAFGSYALNDNSGVSNIAIGTNALRNTGSTSYNTAIGLGAGTGSNGNTGGYNTFLGYTAKIDYNSTPISNATAIGNGALIASSNTIQLGNTAVTNVKTSGTLTAGAVTYPNTHSETDGQVLISNSSGVASWTTLSPSIAASSIVNEDISASANIDQSKIAGLTGALALKAPIASPTFTGTPLAPTAAAGTSTNQLATTAFVAAAASSSNFVDLTTAQTVAGNKWFSSDGRFNELTVGRGSGNNATNTVVGRLALANNTSGSENVAIGREALHRNTTGNANTVVGLGAVYYATSSSAITAFGKSALHAEQGSGNTAIGHEAAARGAISATLTNSTFLGRNATATNGTIDNATAIGSGATVNASNTIQLGNTSITNVKTSGTLTAGAVTYTSTDGTNGQLLTTDGSGNTSWAAPAAAIREVADEFSATTSQTEFNLTQAPSANSRVKMYINGIRISNSAYSWTGTTLVYAPANNGNNTLTNTDRIQFDYFY